MNDKIDEVICPFTFTMQGVSKLTGQPLGSIQKCLKDKCGLYDWIDKQCSYLATVTELREIVTQIKRLQVQLATK